MIIANSCFVMQGNAFFDHVSCVDHVLNVTTKKVDALISMESKITQIYNVLFLNIYDIHNLHNLIIFQDTEVEQVRSSFEQEEDFDSDFDEEMIGNIFKFQSSC